MKNNPEPSPDAGPVPAALHLEKSRVADQCLGRALALVRFLRDRCPWDAKQDAMSLRPYLLEEAHEVAEAIQTGDDEALPDELGDLLLNLAFQIVLAEERGAFDATAVVTALEEKMEARHPHIYGDADEPPDWEAMKATERAAAGAQELAGSDPFEGIAPGLDPLSRAARVQERMAAFGFDWPDLRGPIDKVREETDEFAAVAGTASRRIGEADARVEDEVGDLFFSVVNASRVAGAHPANALLGAIDKFEDRCRRMIAMAESRGLDWKTAELETLDRLWEEIKTQG